MPFQSKPKIHHREVKEGPKQRPKSAPAAKSSSSFKMSPPAPESPHNTPSKHTPHPKKKKKTRPKSKVKITTAEKIKTLTEELIKLRHARKKLSPKYENPRASGPYKAPPVEKVKMEVDQDAVRVAALHSPYLVRPEDGYTSKVLNTTAEIKQTLALSGKKLKDLPKETMPYDLESSKKAFIEEVENFRATYVSTLPGQGKNACSDKNGPITIPLYHNKYPKPSEKPPPAEKVMVLFDPNRPYSAPTPNVTTTATMSSSPSSPLNSNTNPSQSQTQYDQEYYDDFAEDESVQSLPELTIEDYQNYLHELNQDLFPSSPQKISSPESPNYPPSASFFQRSLSSMNSLVVGPWRASSKVNPSDGDMKRPKSATAIGSHQSGEGVKTMRQVQKKHTDLKYRQDKSKSNRPSSSPMLKISTSGRDGERQWPGQSEQFRASLIRGGPNQFRTDKTLVRAFHAFVNTFSPSRKNVNAHSNVTNDEFGVFDDDDNDDDNEDKDGSNWKDFLLSDTAPVQLKEVDTTPSLAALTALENDPTTSDLVDGKGSDSDRIWKMGDAVESWFAGKAKFYSGVIRRVHRKTDQYDIDYDDGAQEKFVPRSYLRSIPASSPNSKEQKSPLSNQLSPSPCKAFVVGDKVLANYKSEGTWYPGVISRVVLVPLGNTKVKPKGNNAKIVKQLYDVNFDDGDKEQLVPMTRLRPNTIVKQDNVHQEIEDRFDDEKLKSPSPKKSPSPEKVFARSRSPSCLLRAAKIYEPKIEDDDVPINQLGRSPTKSKRHNVSIAKSSRMEEISDQLKQHFPNSVLAQATQLAESEGIIKSSVLLTRDKAHVLSSDLSHVPRGTAIDNNQHLVDVIAAAGVEQPSIKSQPQVLSKSNEAENEEINVGRWEEKQHEREIAELQNMMDSMRKTSEKEAYYNLSSNEKLSTTKQDNTPEINDNTRIETNNEEKSATMQESSLQNSSNAAFYGEDFEDNSGDKQSSFHQFLNNSDSSTDIQTTIKDTTLNKPTAYKNEKHHVDATEEKKAVVNDQTFVNSNVSAEKSYGEDFEAASNTEESKQCGAQEKVNLKSSFNKSVNSVDKSENTYGDEDFEDTSLAKDHSFHKSIDSAISKKKIVNMNKSTVSFDLGDDYGNDDFEDGSGTNGKSILSVNKSEDNYGDEGFEEGSEIKNVQERKVASITLSNKSESDYGDDGFEEGSVGIKESNSKIQSVYSKDKSDDGYGDDFEEGSGSNEGEYADEEFD